MGSLFNIISSEERLQICRLAADRRYRHSADILQIFYRHSADDLQIVCRSAFTSVADLQQTINRSARFVRVPSPQFPTTSHNQNGKQREKDCRQLCLVLPTKMTSSFCVQQNFVSLNFYYFKLFVANAQKINYSFLV